MEKYIFDKFSNESDITQSQTGQTSLSRKSFSEEAIDIMEDTYADLEKKI